MTELSEGVRAKTCPNGHPVTAASMFCPSCGQPIVTAPVATAPGIGEANTAPPAFSAQFPTGSPWLLGRPRFGALTLSVLALAWLTACWVFFFYIHTPRLLLYMAELAGLVLLVQRTKRLGSREVIGLTVAAAAAVVVGSLLICPALYRMLGDPRVYAVEWPEAWGIVAKFGAVYLAVGLAALWNPRLRAAISAFLRPHPPTIDVLRGCVVAVLALLALVAVPRAFTGWTSFAVQQSYSDYQHEQRLTECRAGVFSRFPEYSPAEKQAAIDYCVASG